MEWKKRVKERLQSKKKWEPEWLQSFQGYWGEKCNSYSFSGKNCFFKGKTTFVSELPVAEGVCGDQVARGVRRPRGIGLPGDGPGVPRPRSAAQEGPASGRSEP